MKPTAIDSINQAQVLDMVPILNRAVRTERRERAMVLYVPIQQRWWMKPPLRWLFPYRQERGYALDSLGQEVWHACNGRRTVEQIIERFAKYHGVGFHDARAMVLQFLNGLIQRKLVVLVMPERKGVREAD